MIVEPKSYSAFLLASVTTTPRINPQPTALPGSRLLDLNNDGRVPIINIVLAIKAINGLPNQAALVLWPPSGNPQIVSLVDMIRQFNAVGL